MAENINDDLAVCIPDMTRCAVPPAAPAYLHVPVSQPHFIACITSRILCLIYIPVNRYSDYSQQVQSVIANFPRVSLLTLGVRIFPLIIRHYAALYD